MDLKQLRTFLHVVELGSLSRAAERLHLSQPALSRQLKLLEEDVGTPLLVRTGRGVILSEAGNIFAKRARIVLGEMERINEDIAAYKGTVSGALCVGFPPSVGVRIAGPLIEKFHRTYPAVNLRVVQLLSGALHERLLEGRVDIAVLYDGVITDAVRTEALWKEDLWLIGPPKAGLCADHPVSFAEVCQLPMILPGSQHGLRAVLAGYARKHEQTFQVDLEVDSLMVQIDLVRRGLGYTILPKISVEADLQAGLVSAAPVCDPILSRWAILAWSRDYPLSPAGKAMFQSIREISLSISP